MSDQNPKTDPAPEGVQPETPAAKKPAAGKPAAKKPATSTASAAASKKPAVSKPAVSKPAASKPAVSKPAAKKPETATETKPLESAPAAAATTEVLSPVAPVAKDGAEPEPTVVVVEPPVKRRRRWPWVLGGIGVLLVVLLVVGFFVADAMARDYARDYIKQRIVAVLGLDPATPVSVDIGGGSVLFQAMAGRLDSVDVTADEVTFGELTGAATVHAEGVPLDANAETRELDVTFEIGEDQVVAALGDNLSGIELQSVVLEEPEIVVATEIDLFFFKLPIEMGLVPSAEEGAIVFTPTTITLGDEDYTADELRKELGELADAFLQQQTMCVDESLPVALTVTDVDVVATDLVLQINGDGAALGGPDLSTMGTCEG